MLNDELKEFLEKFFDSSQLNRLPKIYGGGKIFSAPLIGVAKGDDYIFSKFKEVVAEEHMTPLEFWLAEGLTEIEPSKLRIISIVFPYVNKIRKESKNFEKVGRVLLPAEIYNVGRNYANELKKETCRMIIDFLEKKGYNAIAAMLSESFSIITKGRFYSNWSERHIAFATGLGTFSLHEGLITELGCNIRLASVVTDAPFEITKRKTDDPYANCLYFAKGTCKKCIEQCPAGAITENGHDKNKCYIYGQKIMRKVVSKIGNILRPHWRRINWKWEEQKPPVGCAFCQFNVPCMDKNPVISNQ